MSHPIRILNLFTNMNRGGAETMVMNYYRSIDRDKVQFDFMVHRQHRGAYDDEIEALGGRIYRMCPIYPQYVFKYKRLLKEFFDQHPEYQILHSHMSELGYFAFKEAIRHGVPVRICHAHSSPNFKIETWIEKLKVIPREIWARQMRQLSTDFFVCSKKAGDWLFGIQNENRFVMMNNAIDAKKFSYDAALSQQKKNEMGWNGKLVVGHVGRFIKAKNHPFLLKVFSAFHKRHPESILVLVGDGIEHEDIVRRIHMLGLDDCVHLLGFRTDTIELYNAFDVFCFPSLYEGLPVSLIEAQASGLPCVVSDTISDQASVLPNYVILSLNDEVDTWVHHLEEGLQFKRYDTIDELKNAGFDIYENAQWLANYYLNRLP